MDNHMVFAGNCDHLHFLVHHFLLPQWSFPDANTNSIVHNRVSGSQWSVDKLSLVVTNHGQKFPIRIARINLHFHFALFSCIPLLGPPMFPVPFKLLDVGEQLRFPRCNVRLGSGGWQNHRFILFDIFKISFFKY